MTLRKKLALAAVALSVVIGAIVGVNRSAQADDDWVCEHKSWNC
jgi:heme A synthase